MQHVFISHAKQDNEIAGLLHDDLEAAGVEVWLDIRDIKPSYDYSAAIHSALAVAPQLIVLLSPNSVASDYVRAEWEFALGNNKQVFVAMVGDVEKAKIPPRLWTIQRVELHTDYQAGLARLIGAIKSAENHPIFTDTGKLRVRRSLKNVDIVVGERATLLISVGNLGPKNVLQAKIEDELPPGIILEEGTNRWGGNLLAGQTIEFEYEFVVNQTGKLNFPGLRLSYQQGGQDWSEKTAAATYFVEAATPPEIKVEVTLRPPVATLGETVDVFYRLINKGNTMADHLAFQMESADATVEVIDTSENTSGITLRRNTSWTHQISLVERRYGRHELPTLFGSFGYGDEQQSFCSPPMTFLVGIGWENELIGREDVQDKLLNLLEQVRARHRQVTFVHGETGVGKSHVIVKFMAQVASLGAICLKGQCQAFHETVAFLPFKQIFERLLSLPKFANNEDRIAEAEVRLQDIVPDIEKHIPSLTSFLISPECSRTTEAPKEQRERFLFAALQLIKSLGQSQTILLFIEDLQWADASTLDLLQFIIDNTDDLPLLILGEYRQEEVEVRSSSEQQTHPLLTFIRHNSTRSFFHSIEIKRLSPTSLNDWLSRLFPKNLFPDAFAIKLYEETEGNPLFLREVLKSLVDRSIIYQDKYNLWRVAEDIGAITLPTTIEQVIASRLDTLNSEQRRELEHASVIGRDFAFEQLQAISESDSEILFAYLENYLNIHLIMELEERADYFRFTHGKIREFTYEAIRQFRRRQIHLRLAKAMEAMFSGSLKSVSPIIGYHFAKGGDMAKALEYFVQAGVENLRLYANKEAQSNFKQALKIVEQQDPAQRDQEQYLKVLEGLGQATRDLNEFTSAIAHYKKTLSLAESLGRDDISLLTMSQLATALSIQGRHEEALEYCDKGVELSTRVGDPNLVLRMLNDLTDLCYRQHRSEMILHHTNMYSPGYEHLEDLAQRTFDYVRANPAEALNAAEVDRAYKNKGLTRLLAADYPGAIEIYEETIRMVEAKNTVQSGYVYVMIGDAYRIVKRDREAMEAYKKYSDWALKIGAKHAEMKAYQVIGQQHTENGEYDEAMALFQKGLALQQKVQVHYPYSQILVCIGYLKEMQGESNNALDYYRQAAKLENVLDEADTDATIIRKVGLLTKSWDDLRLAKYYLERYLAIEPNALDKGPIEAILQTITVTK